jgi:hypothetical protein
MVLFGTSKLASKQKDKLTGKSKNQSKIKIRKIKEKFDLSNFVNNFRFLLLSFCALISRKLSSGCSCFYIVGLSYFYKWRNNQK